MLCKLYDAKKNSEKTKPEGHRKITRLKRKKQKIFYGPRAVENVWKNEYRG